MILIGALSKMSGLSIRTIRFYENKNIVTATIRDDHNNRLYDDETAHWLTFVAYLRKTGMSLADLAAYRTLVDAGPTTLPQRIELLNHQRSLVLSQIEDKQEQIRQIDHKLANYHKDVDKYL